MVSCDFLQVVSKGRPARRGVVVVVVADGLHFMMTNMS